MVKKPWDFNAKHEFCQLSTDTHHYQSFYIKKRVYRKPASHSQCRCAVLSLSLCDHASRSRRAIPLFDEDTKGYTGVSSHLPRFNEIHAHTSCSSSPNAHHPCCSELHGNRNRPTHQRTRGLAESANQQVPAAQPCRRRRGLTSLPAGMAPGVKPSQALFPPSISSARSRFPALAGLP